MDVIGHHAPSSNVVTLPVVKQQRSRDDLGANWVAEQCAPKPAIEDVVTLYCVGRNGVVKPEHDVLGDVVTVEMWDIASPVPAFAAHQHEVT